MISYNVITHADGRRGGVVFSGFCLFVLPQGIRKTDAARIIELYTEMFHRESCTGSPFIFRSKSHESQKLPAWVCALLWVLASSSCNYSSWYIHFTQSLLTFRNTCPCHLSMFPFDADAKRDQILEANNEAETKFYRNTLCCKCNPFLLFLACKYCSTFYRPR